MGSRSSAGPRSQRAKAAQRTPLTVVKLGGSLAAAGSSLPAWLALVARFAGRVVLVPGGGPFADQVRALQGRWGFDEATAHHLALLAMEQYGRLLSGLSPELRPAASRAALRRALRDAVVPVWMPTQMVLGRPEIPASWDVTSDSLALWLAAALDAPRVCLVKSAPAPAETAAATGSLAAAALAARGLVDAAFPDFLARGRVSAWYLGPDQQRALAAGLEGLGDPGLAIVGAGR